MRPCASDVCSWATVASHVTCMHFSLGVDTYIYICLRASESPRGHSIHSTAYTGKAPSEEILSVRSSDRVYLTKYGHRCTHLCAWGGQRASRSPQPQNRRMAVPALALAPILASARTRPGIRKPVPGPGGRNGLMDLGSRFAEERVPPQRREFWESPHSPGDQIVNTR
jgi:hypothetical protein